MYCSAYLMISARFSCGVPVPQRSVWRTFPLRFYSNFMLQIGERTSFIIALCGDFQILDSCQLLESGTVLEFFIRGINEPADRVVFFGITDFRSRFISMRSRIRSFVYSLPSDFILPRTKRSLSRGTERDVFGDTFFKRFPFNFISFGSH